MNRVNWERTRNVLISIVCIGIILWATWGLMGQFVHAIILLLLSLAAAFLLTPAVNFLNRSMPRVPSTLLVYLLVLVVLGALSYALVFSLIQQVFTFKDTAVHFFSNLPAQYTSLRTFLIKNGIPSTNIDDALNQVKGQVVNFAQTTASNLVNIAFVVTNIFIDLLLILVLSFYFTLDGKHIRDNLVSIAPKSWMPHVLVFEDALNRVVGNYIRGQLTLALIIGVLAGAGCAFLGLRDYALIVGVLAFIFETIPMVGPALASIPAILISLLLPAAFPRTFWIVLWFLFIQMVESNVLGPRIVGHAVGLHPVASILALIIGAQLFGAFGALLATPIVAASWVVIASFYRSMRGETADDMLAKRRTPWVIRRPTNLIPRGRRLRHTPTGTLIPATPPDGDHARLPSVKGNALPVEHLDFLSPSAGNTTQNNLSGLSDTTPAMAETMNAEHLDLLRPIPNGEAAPRHTADTNKEK